MLRNSRPGIVSQIMRENCSEEMGGSQDTQEFFQRKACSWKVKRLLLIKENQISHVKEFSAFFYVWEDARVWAH